MTETSIRKVLRASGALASDIIDGSGFLVVVSAGIGIVFMMLFLVTGMVWTSALGTGAFTGFLCTMLVMMLPFTGIASTVLSAAALAAYVAVTGMLGLNHPGWIAPCVALSGIVILPLFAWASVVFEERFGRA